MSWLGELIVDTGNEFANVLLDFVFGIVLEIFGSANTVLNYREINQVLAISNMIASSFLILILMKQILSVYILETDGDSDISPLMLVEKACIALAIIQMQSLLLNFLLGIADKIGDETAAVINIQYESVDDIISAATNLLAHPFLLLVAIVMYVIGFIMFIWKGIKRTIELSFMKILFPIFACDICTVSMERFRSFFMSYMVTIFGYIIQFVSFRMSIVMLYGGTTLTMLMSLGFLFFASSAPKWIDRYTYSSGIGKSAANGARGAMQMVPQLMRMIK